MRLLGLALLCVGLAACSKKTAAESVDASIPAVVVEAKKAPSGEVGLGDLLAAETGARDKADPPTQKVREALGKVLTITREQQHLAKPVGASYCLGFHSDEHLAVSICEYADAKSAEAGAEGSRTAFREIANRTVHVKRSTTLTILENPADAASAEAKKRVVAAFDAL